MITELVRSELAEELRSGLHRAFELREPSLSAFVPVRFNGTAQLVAMLIQPRSREDGQRQYAMVTFLEAGKADLLRRARREQRFARAHAA